MKSHISMLEDESIFILREVAAEASNPVMLYSMGKDSSVMLHLARKAFYPNSPPFPLLHVDTNWKFKDMYEFRDKIARQAGVNLIIYKNPTAIEKGINPFEHPKIHTDIWKTEGLKQAIELFNFDVAIGGARRDEEKSRAKERVFSFRNSAHNWDPKNQRPEFWNLYNSCKLEKETFRVFPLSNWTETDVWEYILLNKIDIVPLYFSALRPCVERDGIIIMVDDERFKLKDDEVVTERYIRFRSLGCYPLTGATESNADNLNKIIKEMHTANKSERCGRIIDKETFNSSIENKKQQGYF